MSILQKVCGKIRGKNSFFKIYICNIFKKLMDMNNAEKLILHFGLFTSCSMCICQLEFYKNTTMLLTYNKIKQRELWNITYASDFNYKTDVFKVFHSLGLVKLV